METLNPVKLSKQKELVGTWLQHQCRGTVVAPTGFGKSLIAILIIRLMNERHPDRTTLVVVPRIDLRNKWLLDIEQHDLVNVQVMVINTAVKQKRSCNLLVIDEVHHAASDTFRLVFDFQYNFILGLTATFDRQDKKHEYLSQYCPVIATIPLSHARKEQFISDFRVFCLGLDMTPDQWEEYEAISDSMSFYFGFFGHDLNLLEACSQSRPARINLAQALSTSEKQVKIYAYQAYRWIQSRKNFLYSLPQKVETVRDILDHLPLKTITFSETIDFVKSLERTIPGSKAIHSKMSQPARKKVLDDFANDRFRIIHSATMLDEGIDVPELEMAIICSGSSSKRQSVQRIGRALRFVPGKTAIIINLFCRGTQEELWVKNRLEGTPNVILVDTYKELLSFLDQLSLDYPAQIPDYSH